MNPSVSTASSWLIEAYPAFQWVGSLQKAVGRVSMALVSTLVPLSFAVGFLICAGFEGALVMEGRDIGLVEHPGIWTFVVGNALFPFVLVKATRCHLAFRTNGSTNDPEYNIFTQSRSVLHVLMWVGFAAFAWNSVQNQAPFEYLGKDFWDSINNPYCYGLTRFYKFYLWVFFAPAVLHAQWILSQEVRRRLGSNSKPASTSPLQPFHPDRCGGFGGILDAVLHPIFLLVALATILNVCAFYVHSKLDITTVGGFLMVISIVLILYLPPAVRLRNRIRHDKAQQLKKIADRQRELYYGPEMDESGRPNIKTENYEELAALAALSKRISETPNWPQLRLLATSVGVYLSSPAVGWAIATVTDMSIAKIVGSV